mgnify:FL=1
MKNKANGVRFVRPFGERLIVSELPITIITGS